MPTGKAGREMLERGLAANQRRRVPGRGPGGEAGLRDEVQLELCRIHALAFSFPDSFEGALNILEIPIEVDQLLGDRPPFGGVGVQERRRAPALQDGSKLPSEVEGVLHRHVHALAGFRAVGVTRVAGDENARKAGLHSLVRHVVELVAETLADLVDDPGDIFDVQRVGMNDPTCGRDQLIRRDVRVVRC